MTSSMCAAPGDTCFGHTGRVFGLAYHPCSHQVLASASEDETVRVWSRSTPTGSWQQASCCRGHTAEVLRVAWSPTGSILASGSADHTVRLWQVGTQGTHSYSGVELAVLSGHPEEVYGLKFISTSTDSSAPPPAADAADEEQQPSGNGSSDVSDMLVTASGESVFLWDLHTGQMLHECAPPPVAGMSALNVNGSPSNKLESSTIGNHSKQQQQQQQQAGQSSEEQGGEETQAEDEEEEQAGPPLLSYIFSLAAAEGTSWLAGACADGMLRLWDAGGNRLQEVAAVQVHVGDMGSVCSFVPQQPWLVLIISKSGQLVLQDIRLLGQALLAQQLQGPVYDMAWSIQQQQQGRLSGQADAAAAEGFSAAGAAAGGHAELQLCVVGRDSCIRSYAFGREALLAGCLPEPHCQVMPESYGGRLLALAAAPDGRALAAAGEAVPAGTLKTTAAPLQQQQQQQGLRQGPRAALGTSVAQPSKPSADADADAVADVAAAAAVPQLVDVAVAAAAAVPAAAARRRKGRSVRPAGAAVDLFSLADDDADSTVVGGSERAQQSQQQQQQHQQQQQPVATDSASSSQQAVATAEFGAGSLAAGDAAAEAQLPACAAAAAGILMRAPLFTWTSS